MRHNGRAYLSGVSAPLIEDSRPWAHPQREGEQHEPYQHLHQGAPGARRTRHNQSHLNAITVLQHEGRKP